MHSSRCPGSDSGINMGSPDICIRLSVDNPPKVSTLMLLTDRLDQHGTLKCLYTTHSQFTLDTFNKKMMGCTSPVVEWRFPNHRARPSRLHPSGPAAPSTSPPPRQGGFSTYTFGEAFQPFLPLKRKGCILICLSYAPSTKGPRSLQMFFAAVKYAHTPTVCPLHNTQAQRERQPVVP